MKVALIDVGSNSVRLMIWADGKTLFKTLKTTRLGEGLSFAPVLKKEAIERTVNAVADFKNYALESGALAVYAYATAAVRSSQNGGDFVAAVRNSCGIVVDVLSGEEEAAVGLAGALGDKDGGIIDVGGASTEVTVRLGGKVVYSHSANIGTVRILDAVGRNLQNIKAFISERLSEYGGQVFPDVKFYAVGGTASRLGAIKNGLLKYDSSVINGTCFTAEEIHALAKRLTDMSVEDVKRLTVCKSSADVVGGGAELLASVMDKFAINTVTVSESDNLEGYLTQKILNCKAD